MVTIGKTNYYSKAEIAERLQCSLSTISNRIVQCKVQGYYFGHTKHYTESQIKTIAESRAHNTQQKAEK